MRFQNLKLTRYGKFTDTEIALPKQQHDFHLIVGPNEAGKSTVRGAIADLLFGFPTRSAAMAFLHPQPELRLAAYVADVNGQLDFVRVKMQKNTLRSASDAALPEDALAAFIGAADRGFFEKMFGLDHTQMVAGGESILDASKDISQVLFQSAAGIAGLGKLKDSLLSEADKLWAPRHSGNRSYYAASDRCDVATKDLKAVTVRTKAWADAREVLDEVERRVAAATQRKKVLQVSRIKLERVRRLAPTAQALHANLAELEALGVVLDMPANASLILSTGEQELSVAETVLGQRQLAVEQLTQQRDAAVYDAIVLAAKADITDLAAFGESVRNHYRDLVTRQAELDRFLELARSAGAELGWSEEESSLRAKMPAPLILRNLQRLVTEHGGLLETKTAATKAVAMKQEELNDAEIELKDTAAGEVSASLRGVIAQAQTFRNTVGSQAKLTASVKSVERTLELALAALGEWRREVGHLQSISVPSTERLSGLVARQQLLQSERNTAADRADVAQQELNDARLDVKHLAESRHIVTGMDVRESRNSRDAKWQSIKDGNTTIDSSAADLEAAIAHADELADTQLDSATDAAELQSLRQTVERSEIALTAIGQTLARKEAELAAFNLEWNAMTALLGLSGLALADAQAWMAKREQVLVAVETRDEKEAVLSQEIEAIEASTNALVVELGYAGLQAPEGSILPYILAQAEGLVSRTDTTNARRSQLQKQLDGSKLALNRLKAVADTASGAYQDWEVKWTAAVVSAGLSDYVKSVADAEQALARVDSVRQNLDKAAATKHDRIDTMNRDLGEFDRMARAVVTALGACELEDSEAREVIRELLPKLREAETGYSRWSVAEDSLRSAKEQTEEAKRAVDLIKAKVAPLLAAAGVQSLADAAPLVERSEGKRKLVEEIDKARVALMQGSDGLGLDAVVAEVDGCDLTQVAIDVASTADSLEQVQSELTRLAEERLQADLAIRAIGGGSDAATAEAHRQEALAGMADSSERYIKVMAAAKLLTWAIDRYREQNQGPMLTRAGAIFATLTLGRYTKLFVDYEKAPPSLSAFRTDGQVVEVPGMSEGTRDQLYLALRLAALELHLAKSKALPFVADDLFINFDDERSTAGLEALKELSTHTQVLFLSHHDHLLPRVQHVFGMGVNVVRLQR
jgi:uncharacterized protein YhaN